MIVYKNEITGLKKNHLLHISHLSALFVIMDPKGRVFSLKPVNPFGENVQIILYVFMRKMLSCTYDYIEHLLSFQV